MAIIHGANQHQNGVYNMKSTRDICHFVDSLVFHYAKFDKLSEQYQLSTQSIPDFDLHELVSLLIKNDPALAMEATGVDNPHYGTLMLPALVMHMQESTNKTLRNDFDEAWLKGITLYLEKTMQSLIDDQCQERLIHEMGTYPTRNRKTNELEWRVS